MPEPSRRIGDASAGSRSAVVNRPLHVALVCHEYPPRPHGGIGSFTEDLAEGLADMGQRVTVLGMGDAPQASRAGVTVLNLAPSRWPRPWRLGILHDRWRFGRWLRALHREQPFDLVELPDYDGWLPFRTRLGIPVVVRLHGSGWLYDSELQRPGDPTLHTVEARSLANATHWVGVSNWAFRRSLALCGLAHKPGEVIYNAVDAERFAPAVPDITESGLIVFVNSLGRRKGLDTLLQAMRHVLPAEPGSHLAVVGGTEAQVDKWRATLDGFSAEHRIRIRFVGRQDRRTEVVQWLRRAQVCCYPSRSETFGLAPVEAMSVGRPTIYSKTGPGPEIVEDETSGLLCDPDDPLDVAERILRLLRDPAMGRRLGRAARERVVEKFDRRRWLDANLSFYRRCVFGEPGRSRQAAARPG